MLFRSGLVAKMFGTANMAMLFGIVMLSHQIGEAGAILVALLVGVLIGKEVLTGWVYLALPLIGGALAMIMYGPAIVGWVRSRTARP